MVLNIIKIILVTGVYGYRLIGKSEEEKNKIKQIWGTKILLLLGLELSVMGSFEQNQNQIIVGNHISFLDIPVLLAVCPNAVFIAKDALKFWPIIGSSAKLAGTIFIARTQKNSRSAGRSQIISHLNGVKNTSIVVFPSGTTSLEEIRPWKKGIFEVAKDLSIPIQSFKLSYEPLRECAYIDHDIFLKQLYSILKMKKKRVTLTWLEHKLSTNEPMHIAEELRMKVLEYVI